MAEASSTDSPHGDELEYGSEPANEVETAGSPRARGRKRRSADVNNGLVSPSTSVEPKEPAQGKRARGEEAGGKRVRKANSIFADYLPTDKKTAHTLLGQEPTNGKGRKEVLMTPAEARTKKLAKGYQYVAADEAKPVQAGFSHLPGKRERKKPVHADFVDEAQPATGAAKPKKISVTISNPNTNPTLSNAAAAAAAAASTAATTPTAGGRRGRSSSGGVATPEPALLDSDDKPAKRTKSEQSRQAKLDFTLTMLNDQLAAVTSSIRNKESVSLPPVEPEASTVDSPQNDEEAEEAEVAQGPQSPSTPAAYPTTPASNRGRNKKAKSESARAKRPKPPRAQSPPSPTIASFSASRPVRTRKVRTPSSIAGDVVNSRGLMKCQEMVRDLLKHEDAWPFAKPVDPVQLNIPDYFDIIKHPMDLGTVKTQLTNGHYDTVEALEDDIRLVFINTRTYNKPDSDIVIMARSVEDLFERRLEAIKSQGFHDLCEDEEPQGTAKIEERIQQLSSQLKVATEEIKRLKKDKVPTGTPTATPAKTNYKGRPRDDNRPMSFEEKRRLSVQINNLSSEKLMKVVQIIHESNPKVAQSSAPDVIEIDIDALDTSTLRHLERVVRQSQPRQRSTSSASASPAPNRLAQAELAASGTKERIADVKRQLDALNRSLGTKKKNTKSTKKNGEDEDVVIDDEAPSKGNESDSGSSSDSSSSDSSSESDSSETSSDSDSESDQEQIKPPPPKLPTTANVPKFPFVNTAITPVAMPIMTNPIIPTFPQPTSAPLPLPLPRTPPASHDGVVFSLDTTQVPTASNEEADIPEIKPSTGTKKVIEAISWNTSVLETPTTTESPATPPPAVAGTTDQMWSQFQNKNILQKQKEKEREEQEELLRKEREEREEERKREDERRKKELEEAEVRKQRDSEAEKEQKKKEMMEQRAKAKEEREKMQGKNMTEQFDVMASFERENRTSAPFQLSSLDLQSLSTAPNPDTEAPSSDSSAPSTSSPSSTSPEPSTTESTITQPPSTSESAPDTSSSAPPLPLDTESSVTPA